LLIRERKGTEPFSAYQAMRRRDRLSW